MSKKVIETAQLKSAAAQLKSADIENAIGWNKKVIN
jgi:hypothetical protein